MRQREPSFSRQPGVAARSAALKPKDGPHRTISWPSRLTSTQSDARRSASSAARATVLVVPMLKDDELIGAIVIYRQEVRPFTDKQIELVRTSPPRPSSPSRTRACSTSCRDEICLEQQTATARGAQGHLQLARRAGAGVPGHAGERDAHLRGKVRQYCCSTKARRFGWLPCTMRRLRFVECHAQS